jgi:hypothetical protein
VPQRSLFLLPPAGGEVRVDSHPCRALPIPGELCGHAAGLHSHVVQSPTSALPREVADSIGAVRARLARHRLYRSIRTPEALRTFAEHHAVCVLDFMSLLKSLQRDLTCVAVPWTPVADPESARLIQRIVLDEETDERADGRIQSHFAWYLEAMEEIGADTAPARALVGRLAAGDPLGVAIRASALPAAARSFGEATAAVLDAPLHIRAAVFFHGREDVIPEMFLQIIEQIERDGLGCATLREYLLRHAGLDRDDHGPRARALLERIYAGDEAKRTIAEQAACQALIAREILWDAVADALAPRG